MSSVEAFRITVGALVAFSSILAALQVWVVDERRYGSGKSSQVNLLNALKMTFSNKTFVLYTLTNQVYYWADGFFQNGLIYFVTIIFGYSDSMMIAFGAVIMGLSFVIYPFVGKMAKRTGKKNLYMIALVAMTVITFILGFADKLPFPVKIVSWILVAMIALPGAITGIIPGAINNEIIREDCLRTGESKEASSMRQRVCSRYSHGSSILSCLRCSCWDGAYRTPLGYVPWQWSAPCATWARWQCYISCSMKRSCWLL